MTTEAGNNETSTPTPGVEKARKNPYHNYEYTCIFGGFRFDHGKVRARSEKEAKKRVKNGYYPKYRRDVAGIKVRRIPEEVV